jgi:hypothetical protein
MTTQAKALVKWLTDNVIKTYSDPVPKNATLPYAVLGYGLNPFGRSYLQQVIIWTQSEKDYSKAYGYVDKLETAIGHAGALITGVNCRLWVQKGEPFAQNNTNRDADVRSVLVNLEVTAYYNI